MMTRPGVLAVRAINQYRRRDVIAYLGLRYYLDNKSAQRDLWARDVATQLELLRSDGGYLHVKHFKEIDDEGQIRHRDLRIPRPNEAIAEAALIDACSKTKDGFTSDDNVYSYVPASGIDRSGVFLNYMHGLRHRHDSITLACQRSPDAIVCFRDLKKFYPSISVAAARDAWERACHTSGLERKFADLGSTIIERQGRESGGNLLTGPIFSHLIGNLVLRDLDKAMTRGPARYFRYVDDITFVGKAADVKSAIDRLEDSLGKLGLQLHPEGSPKSLDIQAASWLEAKDDFKQHPGELSWMSFIGDLKRLLLWHPERTDALRGMLQDEGFRIPLMDYSQSIHEADYLGRSIQLLRNPRLRWRSWQTTPELLISQAKDLRQKYEKELWGLVDGLGAADPFLTKRLVPKARYRMGRLAYLASSEQLIQMAEAVDGSPSLRFHAEVMRAISTANVDRLLPLGTNAAQAAAQPLRTITDMITLSRNAVSDVEVQSLAVFALNGITTKVSNIEFRHDELARFAQDGVSTDLMQSSSPFIAEIACLHGMGTVRHADVLDSAFDEDEDLAMDAVDQARTSFSL